ncbi:NADPH-dependent FMN reductase [Tessaracoccus sp. MC1756]|uniref:NADPH-dependent FMN reductase n=1 Tax=Tessaracoccus sp. MC1756 TaxID=2760311 RepID=UPI001604621E|nr:NADPH-dependent FMN reductase [Tessaracoccus sp. MC1756]MBB1509569.1 NAD(P)H-dependent oxidoreductase [Tessaracoccus sp. MC1756]
MRIGYIVGSLSSTSINRSLAKAIGTVLPAGVEYVEVNIADLPLYNRDADVDYPQVALDFKAAVADVDAVIFVTPEYSRTVPAALKNALEWGGRPWGTSVWGGKPAAVIGTSPGGAGTAMAQQHLRNVLAHLDMQVMGQPEAFVQFRDGDLREDGTIQSENLRAIIEGFVGAFVTFSGAEDRLAA